MKSRELVLWCILLILLAVLFRQCGRADLPDAPANTILVKGKTDTVIKVETTQAIRYIPKPVPVYVYMDTVNTGNTGNTTSCDSIRFYQDSLVNLDGIASVQSSIRGELLNQNIELKVFHHDTSFFRVDTLITQIGPPVYSLSLAGSMDLYSGPGIGVMVGLRRWSVAYQYRPVNKSHELMAGYRIFAR